MNDNENEISSLALYPNPTDGFLNIASESIIISVRVYNQLGQLVFEEENKEGIIFINMNKLAKGLYFAKLIDATSKSDVKKVILK